MFDKKDLIADITANHEEIQRGISRMELDLLPGLLKRRTELLEAVNARVLEMGIPHETARDLFCEVNGQNTRIRARIQARADAAGRKLKEMYGRARGQKAYRD